MGYWIRAHYLDASALVKLIAEDDAERPGREALRNYYWANAANVYSTSHSITEALSAFKHKWVRKEISGAQYKEYIDKFLTLTIGANLRVEDDEDVIPILSKEVGDEAERMIDAYDIDFLDCFQLIVIKRGHFRHMVGGSKTLLITADRNLAKAARKEGLSAWCCLDELVPPFVESPTWWADQQNA
jgi:predicted nucleic acid-binding protein